MTNYANKTRTILFQPIIHFFLYPLTFILFSLVLTLRLGVADWKGLFLTYLYGLAFFMTDRYLKKVKQLSDVYKSVPLIVMLVILLLISVLLGLNQSWQFMALLLLNGVFLIGQLYFETLLQINRFLIVFIRSIYYGLIFNLMLFYYSSGFIYKNMVVLLMPIILFQLFYQLQPSILKLNKLIYILLNSVPYSCAIILVTVGLYRVMLIPLVLFFWGVVIVGQSKILPSLSLHNYQVSVMYQLLLLSIFQSALLALQ